MVARTRCDGIQLQQHKFMFLIKRQKNKDSGALEKVPCGDCVEPKSLWNTLGKSIVTPL